MEFLNEKYERLLNAMGKQAFEEVFGKIEENIMGRAKMRGVKNPEDIQKENQEVVEESLGMQEEMLDELVELREAVLDIVSELNTMNSIFKDWAKDQNKKGRRYD